MMHTRDTFADAVRGGHPTRRAKQRMGNVFVTKCTTRPCGWNREGAAWTKKVGGQTLGRDEIMYALLPADLFHCTVQDGDPQRRMINDGYLVPALRPETAADA